MNEQIHAPEWSLAAGGAHRRGTLFVRATRPAANGLAGDKQWGRAKLCGRAGHARGSAWRKGIDHHRGVCVYSHMFTYMRMLMHTRIHMYAKGLIIVEVCVCAHTCIRMC
jgi:hypothetical protein